MQNQPGRLSGKVAIVTGAGATGAGDFVGIGQAISILFARQGASVLLVDRDQANAETTLATIREEGRRGVGVPGGRYQQRRLPRHGPGRHGPLRPSGHSD